MRREYTTKSEEETKELGRKIGAELQGGEIIELISDLGGGKTVFVRGLAAGMDSEDEVMSPTFTIERLYRGRNDLVLYHFDFYRLHEAGVVGDELYEAIQDDNAAIVIEWGEIVHDVLPDDRLIINITAVGDGERSIAMLTQGKKHERLLI